MVPGTVQVSPRLSFKGYNILIALDKNKDLVKGLVAVIAGYSYFNGFSLPAFWTAVGSSVVVLAGKLLVDAIDYFFSEVTL